jgi:pyruvate dehydrogenase E1 component alpha subunit
MTKAAEATPRAPSYEGGADPDAFRILDADGQLLGGAVPPLGPKEAVEAYRWMLFSRALDERAVSLQRQGRIGTYSAVYGQEASVVGVASALDPSRDWIVPQYRETPALLRHGMPLSTMFLYYIGNPLGARVPEGVLLTPIQIALAAQLPHAVGLAMGLKIQRRPGVVATFCGDGASSEGDFHEALNLAGVTRAPVVFVVQNNGYAISTPRSRQTGAKTFASRAEGYGFPGVKVDGNDLLAVVAVAQEAVARAGAGGGPTLIETQTYRLFPHNTADDQTRYVPADELEQRRKEDPIPRMRGYLRSAGLLDEHGEQEILDEIADQISAAVADAESRERPSPDQVFEHVYARPWSRVLRQREEIVGSHEEGDG